VSSLFGFVGTCLMPLYVDKTGFSTLKGAQLFLTIQWVKKKKLKKLKKLKILTNNFFFNRQCCALRAVRKKKEKVIHLHFFQNFPVFLWIFNWSSVFLLCVCVSRIGLWGFDVAHLKLMQVLLFFWQPNSEK
jgi:hypothetical protein